MPPELPFEEVWKIFYRNMDRLDKGKLNFKIEKIAILFKTFNYKYADNLC